MKAASASASNSSSDGASRGPTQAAESGVTAGPRAPPSASTAATSARTASETEERVKAILRRKEEEVKEMLAPEKGMHDIDVLVGKVVAEVKALEARGGDQGADNSEYTFLAAVETAPQFRCPVCGNKQQTNFMLDSKQGDTICLGADGQGCGTVVQDHKVHEGSMYRKFEGEADRSHHGPAPNRLYSTAHNMRTWISEGKDANKLRNLAEDVEMGLSTVGKDERKTRTAYKDQMKREAFDRINHIAGNCDLHEVVTVRAKELFAGWRNVKEHVHQKDAVICACIIAAYREIGTEELSRMFLRRQEDNADDAEEGRQNLLYPFVCAECKAGFNAAKALDFHRREVHKSAAKAASNRRGAGPRRPYSEWSLSDAREWLTSVVAALNLPSSHVDTVCAALEKSLSTQASGQRVGMKRKATKTAGQLLMMFSLDAFLKLCGGDAAGIHAAEKLHHETARKRAEKSRQDKSRIANYNAAQRNNQIVRKPWVAHINAELNTASERKRAKAGAAAERAGGSAGHAAAIAAAIRADGVAETPPSQSPPPAPPSGGGSVAGTAPIVAPAIPAPETDAVGSLPSTTPAAGAGGVAPAGNVVVGGVSDGVAGVGMGAPALALGTGLGTGTRPELVGIDLAGR